MPRATWFPKLEKWDTSLYLLGWGGSVIDAETELDEKGYIQMPYAYYPRVYTIKIIATVVAMILVIPGYLSFPLRLNWYVVQRRNKRLPPVALAFKEFLLAEG